MSFHYVHRKAAVRVHRDQLGRIDYHSTILTYMPSSLFPVRQVYYVEDVSIFKHLCRVLSVDILK